ncbi:hypothetical protein HYC85_005674 [Camellia sinensis]|uniref:Uncharacterized protein n=1 Tax=Camellia sinensis TaxID=4442 RepID=A0A7J7I0J4_CAMSI|nr:hypothetical protein HYC85_005674 [Camellia sinensis]
MPKTRAVRGLPSCYSQHPAIAGLALGYVLWQCPVENYLGKHEFLICAYSLGC